MKKHEKKIFTVVVEKRQRYEIDVDAFDARGARGQLLDGGEVDPTKITGWRAVGEPEVQTLFENDRRSD